MFKVKVALSAGVDSKEFTFMPALTILKHDFVQVDMEVRVSECVRLDLQELASVPEKFANLMFEQHIKSNFPSVSHCTQCARFCLDRINLHRTTIIRDNLNSETVVRISGASIGCKDPCPPALNQEVARKIREQLLNRGYGHNQIVPHLEQLVEIHLTDLYNEANFDSMASYEASSGPMGTTMHTYTIAKREESRKSFVFGYLRWALDKHLSEFVLPPLKQNPPKNNGIPLTQIESVW